MTPAPDSRSRPETLPLSPRTYGVVVALLLLLGAQTWLILGRSDFGRPFQYQLVLGAAAVSLLALVPAVGGAVLRALEFIRHPSRRARLVAAGCIAIVSACYLVFTGWYQGRDFQPKWQDEMSYIIQFRMLAEGRLWLPRHELAGFFDSFQLIVDPVYASMYFPGAALLYAPAQWLGLPFWAVSVAMSGVSVALLYLIVTEAIDGVAGALAAVMILGMFMFRKLSLMIGGHPPMLMLELAMIYSYLRWREHRTLGWAAAIGLFAGWGAITRPLDAVVVALPVGLMMLLDLRRKPLRRWIQTVACLVTAAAPFLAIQIVFNVGVTGKWYRTPFEHYADRDYPGTNLGFHAFDPARRPASPLPQKQKFHDEWTIPAIKQHTPERVIVHWLGEGPESPGQLHRTLADGMPHRLMMILLPAGLLGLTTRRRLAVWLALPLFIVLFSFYTFYLSHYMIIVAPAIILWVLLGKHVIENAWPRLRAAFTSFLTLAIVILSVTETAELNRIVADEIFNPVGLMTLDEKLERLPHRPAVVLFRFDAEKNNPHEEPVYNTAAAWPDDAEIIRAHDLGRDRNGEIFRYYARHQPERHFYRYDRGDDSITYLGTARELAAGIDSTIR